MPAVTIVGSGLAGISAATRLMEQGFDITLYEQNNFLGGKLGAHRQQGSLDPHEHCYHMYVNWFNNFWQFMTEIGAADKFMPSPVIGCRLPGEKQTRPYLTNPGSPATVLTNMLNGVAAPADQFLATYSLLDLVGTPSAPGDTLGQTSVSNFFRSKDYSSDGSIAASARTLAEAFASPSYLSSTRSYQNLVKFGFRDPAPALWLLTQNTNDAIFEPWRQYLEVRARDLGRGFDLHCLTRVEKLHMTDGRVQKLTLGKMSRNVTTERGVVPEPGETWEVAVPDDLILAVPPGALARLVGPDVAAHAPNLANVRRLRSEPMISLDVYFRREIPGLTKNITLLLESNHNLSLLDISQVWNDSSKGGTILNVVSSNSNPIIDYPNHVILDLMLSELRRFLDFKLGATTVDQSLRDDDVDYHRSHVQTNIGAELFVNQVGSWEFRPKATCGIPNLFIAGDFCQTFVDVVTVEGAVVSGLIAAEALRRRRGIGEPIEIITPDAYPAFLPAMLAAALRPAALAAKAVSVADTMIRGHFSRIFPNG